MKTKNKVRGDLIGILVMLLVFWLLGGCATVERHPRVAAAVVGAVVVGVVLSSGGGASGSGGGRELGTLHPSVPSVGK